MKQISFKSLRIEKVSKLWALCDQINLKKYIVLSIVSVFLLSGCQAQQNSVVPSLSEAPKDEASKGVSEPNMMLMRDAQEGKYAVVCEVTQKDGSGKSTMMIKGKKMKMVGASVGDGNSKIGNMINDGAFLYMWNEGEKQGIKTDLTKPQPSTPAVSGMPILSPMSDDYDQDDGQHVVDDGYTYSCVRKDVADSEFVPPVDVIFTDPSEMMKNILQVSLPPVKTDGSMSEEELQKLQDSMKQYMPE